MTYPESLLSAARAVQQVAEEMARRRAQAWDLRQAGIDGRSPQRMIDDHLRDRAEGRRAREIEAHYERELAAYEASLRGGDHDE